MVPNMKFIHVLGVSTLASLGLLANAYLRQQQFYPTLRHLSTNPLTFGVLALQGLLLSIAIFQVFIFVFLGELRRWEIEECVEKLWPSVFESMIAFALFQKTLTIDFTTKFVGFLFLKFLHWAAESRVNSIENRLRPSWVHQVRLCLLQLLLFTLDIGFGFHFISEIQDRGVAYDTGVKLVFAFEFLLLGVSISFTVFKYILNVIELYQTKEILNRALYTSCAELVAEVFRCAATILFAREVMNVRQVPPVFAVRPIYRSILKIRKTLETIIQAGIAIVRLNSLPTATAEDLERVQGVCLVCRDEMTEQGTSGRAVRIPCGHVFHFACFRSWVQRQQTCPVCRQSVFMEPVNVNTHGYDAAAENHENEERERDTEQPSQRPAITNGNQPSSQQPSSLSQSETRTSTAPPNTQSERNSTPPVAQQQQPA